MIRDEIFARLRDMNIPFDFVNHEAVRSIGDCKAPGEALSCVVPKNLFLTPRNQSAYYLYLVPPDGVFRTADISKKIGSSRLSFSSEEALFRLLRTHPGAVSPMGLLFDADRAVRLLVDPALRTLPRLGFHPNDDTCTLAMSGSDFFGRFLPALGVVPTFVSLSEG